MVPTLPRWRARTVLLCCSVWAGCHALMSPSFWWAHEAHFPFLDRGLPYLEVGCALLAAVLLFRLSKVTRMGVAQATLVLAGAMVPALAIGEGFWWMLWFVPALWLTTAVTALAGHSRSFVASSLVLLAACLSMASVPLLGWGFHLDQLWRPLADLQRTMGTVVMAACGVVVVACLSAWVRRPHSASERWLLGGVAVGATGLGLIEGVGFIVAGAVHTHGLLSPPSSAIADAELGGRLANGIAGTFAALSVGAFTRSWLLAFGGTARSRGARQAWRWVAAPGVLIVCVVALRAPAETLPFAAVPLVGLELPSDPFYDIHHRSPDRVRTGRPVRQVVMARDGATFVITPAGLEPLDIERARFQPLPRDEALAFIDARSGRADAVELLSFLHDNVDHVSFAVTSGSAEAPTAAGRWSFARALGPKVGARWSDVSGHSDVCELTSGRSCTAPATWGEALKDIAFARCAAPLVPPTPLALRSRLGGTFVDAEPVRPLTEPVPPRPRHAAYGAVVGALMALLLLLRAPGRPLGQRPSWARPRDSVQSHATVAGYRAAPVSLQAPWTRATLARALANRAQLLVLRALPPLLVVLAAAAGSMLGR